MHLFPEVKTKADLTTYMDTVAKNEKSILAFNAGGSGATSMLQQVFFGEDTNEGILIGGQGSPLAYDKTNFTKVVTTNLLDDPKYLDELKQLQTDKNKGYWSQNALSNKNTNESSFDNGTSATYMRAPLNVAQAYMNDNLAHPDRALMVLDLLRNNKEINDLTTLGITGTHWEAVGDTQYKALPEGKNFGPDSACPWGWRTGLYRTDASSPQAVIDINKNFESKAKVNPIQLFNFDSTNVKSEVAAVSAVLAVYNPILYGGFAPDIAKTVKEFKSKLDAAGYQKIVTLWKTQADWRGSWYCSVSINR